MKRTIAGLTGAAALIAGCNTADTARLQLQPIEVASFEMQDRRPHEDRVGSKSASPAGDITVLSEDAVSPPPQVILKTWLHEKLGERIAGATVVLDKFAIQTFVPAVQINEQAYRNAMNSTPGANDLSGLLAKWMIGGIERLKSDKTVGVRIEGTIGGQAFSGAGSAAAKSISESDIGLAITRALDATVSDITRLLDEKAAPAATPAAASTETAKQP